MKILLVDDSLTHRNAGKEQLGSLHNLTAVADYTDAVRIAQDSVFDVALLDLLMPAEATTLGGKGLEFIGEEIPVGFPLAVKMSMCGVSQIIVATDINHHYHPASAIVDWFGGGKLIRINDSIVRFIHSPLNEDRAKDWRSIIERFIS